MPEKQHLALALSGGGFRATFFHLGVLKFLRDTGQLESVTHITSVSGGSVLAAHVLLHWDMYIGEESKFQEAANELVRFARIDLRGSIGRRLIATVGLRNSTKLLQRYYDKYLFHESTLGDWRGTPRQQKPTLVVLTTNLTRVAPTGFSAEGICIDAQKPSQILPSSRVPVSLAVAASSAYPALFSPLRISADQLGLSQEDFNPSTQYFTDGGVIDNSGAAVLSELIKNQHGTRMLTSDAGRKVTWNDKDYGLIAGIIRTYDITMNEVASHQTERLSHVLPAPPEEVKITEVLPIEVAKWPEDDQRFTANIRTDFDRFSDIEIGSLIRHGYMLASRRFRTDAPLKENGGFRASISEKGEFWVEDKRRDQVLWDGARVRLRLFWWRDPILLVPACIAAAVLALSIASFAMAIRNQWMNSSGQDMTLDQVALQISGPGQDREKQLFRRGLMNSLLSMAFESTPITGSIDTTKSVVLKEHTTAFIQGAKQLIKLQRFDLPSGAKEVRAQSRDEATKVIATVWAWLEKQDGSVERINRVFSEGSWRIDDNKDYRYFYVIALYDVGLFTAPGEFSGAEIDDLAGLVQNVYFVVGGAVENLGFGEVFEFASSTPPLKIRRRNPNEVDAVSDPAGLVLNTFHGLIRAARQRPSSEGTEKLNEAISVWDEFLRSSTEGVWAGFRMSNVRNDFIVRVDGSRTK